MTAKPAGDSSEQQKAGVWLISALSKELDVPLAPKRFTLAAGQWMEIDGFAEFPPVLCEAWARIGTPQSAQKAKVMTDALKLLYAKKIIGGQANCIFLFADQTTADHFQGSSWMAQCLREHDIQVRVIALPPDLREKVEMAQRRQER